jgi:hypothetical protein
MSIIQNKAWKYFSYPSSANVFENCTFTDCDPQFFSDPDVTFYNCRILYTHTSLTYCARFVNCTFECDIYETVFKNLQNCKFLGRAAISSNRSFNYTQITPGPTGLNHAFITIPGNYYRQLQGYHTDAGVIFHAGCFAGSEFQLFRKVRDAYALTASKRAVVYSKAIAEITNALLG